MAAKKTTKKVSEEPKTEAALVVHEKQQAPLVLEGDPQVQLDFAKKAANALMKVVKPRNINGRQYLEFGAWQTLGRFFGSTVGIEWTKKIEENGVFKGWEARAVVYRNEMIISSAEAMCMTAERNWKSRDEFALRSMAQTRASAKALRNAFGWVAELAGYASTPAEEMDYETHSTPPTPPAAPRPAAPPPLSIANQRKQIIAKHLMTMGHDVRTMSKTEADELVKRLTGLQMVESSLIEIGNRLSVLAAEHREAEEQIIPEPGA